MAASQSPTEVHARSRRVRKVVAHACLLWILTALALCDAPPLDPVPATFTTELA